MLISENSLEIIDPCMLNFSKLSEIIRSKSQKLFSASDGPDEFLRGYQRDINNFF